MRSRQEILLEITENINKAPKETRCMLIHERCFVEALVDIRDILSDYLPVIDGHLLHHSNQP